MQKHSMFGAKKTEYSCYSILWACLYI